MKRCVSCAAALALLLAAGFAPNVALGQGGGLFKRASFQPRSAMPTQAMPSPVPTHETLPSPNRGSMGMPSAGMPPAGMTMEQHHGGGGGGYYSDGEYVEGGYSGYGGGSGSYGCDSGCCDGGCYGDAYCCDDGCGDCCEPECGSSWWNCGDWCDLGCCGGQKPRWYATADYLYVRASFSEAVAYLEHNDDGTPTEFEDTFHELNFRHQSSYRFGGGYYLGCCDEQLRFMYTRMQSDASGFTTDPNAIGPFETSPGPGGQLDFRANVDSHSWDLEYAKTIPLGGNCNECCDACCDPCGCGDACCPPACPAWDITWSGGVRFANVEWARHYNSFNPQTDESRDADSSMDFEGGGPRFGLEGRRYFGQRNWCSAYVKGDISLLLGNLQFNESRVNSDDTPPDIVTRQSSHNRNIIPVTEIEAGLTSQLTSRSRFSAGYLFSAWHDLGFRDQFDFATFLETNYDDGNILGWDGFFARLEFLY
jgi:hypothetical protein